MPGQVPVPDIHNCPVSAGAQSAKMLPLPHVFVSALLIGAQVTFLQTVCQQTLDTCSCSEALSTKVYVDMAILFLKLVILKVYGPNIAFSSVLYIFGSEIR